MRTNNSTRNMRTRTHGFSLLELVSVIAIIGILAAAIVGLGDHMKKKAQATRVVAIATNICMGLRAAHDEGTLGSITDITAFQASGTYPSGIDSNNKDTYGDVYSITAPSSSGAMSIDMSANPKVAELVLGKINAEATTGASIWAGTPTPANSSNVLTFSCTL